MVAQLRRLTSLMVAGTLCAVLEAGAIAQDKQREPINTDRPDFTESAQIVPAGTIQLESGYTFTRTGDQRSSSLGEVMVRIPASLRSEVRLELGSYTWQRGGGESARGFEDPSLGFKVKLVSGATSKGTDVAFLAHTTLPVGSGAFREKAFQPEAKLAADFTLSDRYSLSANLIAGWPSDGGQRFGQFSASTSLSCQLTGKASGFLELYGFLPGNKEGPNLAYLDTGVTYLLNNDHQIDFRVGVGLNGAHPEYFLGAGFAVRW